MTLATAADQWEHPAPAAMVEHRLVGQDQELVEGESSRRSDLGDEGGEPEDPRGNFVCLRIHEQSPLRVSAPNVRYP
jgi:hypothetical protein